MKTTDDCQIDDGFVNYLVFTYCTFDLDLIWISLILIVSKLIIFEFLMNRSVKNDANNLRDCGFSCFLSD